MNKPGGTTIGAFLLAGMVAVLAIAVPGSARELETHELEARTDRAVVAQQRVFERRALSFELVEREL